MTFALPTRPQRANSVPIDRILMANQALCFALFFTVQLIYQVTVIGLNPFQMVLVGVVLEVTCVLFEVPIGVLAGTLACVPLGLLHIQPPMLLAGVGMFGLAAALLMLMPERRRQPDRPAARSAFGQVRATALEGLRLALDRPVVKLIIAISFITGLAAEAWDRLYIPSAIGRFDFPSVFGTDSPVTWFAMSGVIGTLLGLAASELFKCRRSAALSAGSSARLLAGCASLRVAAIAVFTLSGSLWLAFGMLWLRTMADAVSRPVQLAWLNRNLDAATRATVISMTGQANSVGQVAGGPALGWVGSAYSIRSALLGSALVLTPTIALYRRLIVREDTATPAAVPAALGRSRVKGQDTT